MYIQVLKTIDIEYNKRLDRQRPCLEDDLNGGSNLQYKVTNQFDAVVVVQHFVLAIISSLVVATFVLIHKM